MNRKGLFIFSGLIIIIFSIWLLTNSKKENKDDLEITKISLRDVGNQLLLANQDSTSLVLPVLKLEESKYRLSFQKQLIIEPDSLVNIVERSFEKAELDKAYRIEVIKCADNEVAYSYQMKNKEGSNIIPCRGRNLPINCYLIDVRFINGTDYSSNKNYNYYILLIIGFLLGIIGMLNKKRSVNTFNIQDNYILLGSLSFYPEQNKLVKAATEINLSRKECELLEIFVANPNQIVKRDELTKKVWEDNGVIVGRSLDTYISKLRKKLQLDTSIKLTNIHGVGYKLEVSN